jgi:chemotaxis response regulator CheB
MGLAAAFAHDSARKPYVRIVGIGASAGGLEAFRSSFENMPADSGMAFVVILHLLSLSENFDSGSPGF